jgi:hypothetical protein
MRMIVMKDDLDHALDADETLALTVDGVTYTIDLCAKNAHELRMLLAPYLDAAHDRTKITRTKEKIDVRPQREAATAVKYAKADRMEMRRWGAANGFTVGQGRLSKALVEAYNAAH